MHRKESNHTKSSSAKGVLTITEQNALAADKQNFQVLTNGEVFFFTDDPTLCDGLLAGQGFTLHRLNCPHFLPSKRGLPSKFITTAEKYISVYRRNEKQITSIDELALYLDQQPA